MWSLPSGPCALGEELDLTLRAKGTIPWRVGKRATCSALPLRKTLQPSSHCLITPDSLHSPGTCDCGYVHTDSDHPTSQASGAPHTSVLLTSGLLEQSREEKHLPAKGPSPSGPPCGSANRAKAVLITFPTTPAPLLPSWPPRSRSSCSPPHTHHLPPSLRHCPHPNSQCSDLTCELFLHGPTCHQKSSLPVHLLLPSPPCEIWHSPISQQQGVTDHR